ncbi:MAG: aminotransferase class V-fold PLP-dependent enzyme [Opitutae bacterium]|nr:aminotransferase class V-fold PLP-dependent enzyme [Opitutae bacterium]
MTLEEHFRPYRDNIIGQGQEFDSPCGRQRILYADWTASGRLYAPIEQIIRDEIAPLVGNTHTETTVTGTTMTRAYHEALRVIRHHVRASAEDVVICQGSGMTGVVNKFQRILGLRIHERFRGQVRLPETERPVVFVSHMEHHSNQTSWIETLGDVVVIAPDAAGLVDLSDLRRLLEKYAARTTKIAAVTACSNVTGILTPGHEIASLLHAAGGLCFVDFACCAPYVDIDMHPAGRPGAHFDAIYFSPHKFLGGPGSSGVLVFNKALYHNQVPDQPGGGTVDWTNPWGGRKYFDDIEAREDGGTPGFLQAIRTALCLRVKEAMGVAKMRAREEELLAILWPGLQRVPGLHLLADGLPRRLPILSFYVDGLHYNLAVRLLNDRFGVQTRGGCSCAGTYGHYLLHVSPRHSKSITDRIDHGDKSDKPGWVRLSVHPTTSDAEAHSLVRAVTAVAAHFREWGKDYTYDPHTNEFAHRAATTDAIGRQVQGWFGRFAPGTAGLNPVPPQ